MNLPGTLDDASVETTDSRYGHVAFLRGDDPIGLSLRLYGEWAQLELDVLLALIGPGDTVIDAGANIGTHALAFSRAVGTGGRVLAFEPQQRLFELLQYNLDANGARNAALYRLALGAAAGVCYVPHVDYSAHLNAGAVALRVEPDERAVAVDVTPLDALALAQVRLIKIDVEGMEADVIRGAAETLERCRPYLFVECNSVASGAQILSALRDARYDVYFVRSAAFNAGNFRRNADNRFGPSRESNLLCVPVELEAHVPGSLAGGREVYRISDLDELAAQLLRTPRYGDRSEHDRDPNWLAEELARAHADFAVLSLELERLHTICEAALGQHRLTGAAGADPALARGSSEIARLEYRLAKQLHQLESAEQRAACAVAAERERVRHLEAALEAAGASESERRARNTELEQALREAARERADLESASHRPTAAVDERPGRIAELERELEAAHAAALARELELQRRIDELGAAVRAAAARMDDLAISLEAARAQARANLTRARSLEASQARADARNVEVADVRRQLDAETERVAELKAESDAADRNAAAAEAARAGLAATVERLTDDVRARDAVVESLLHSRSWRLTAPLRRMKLALPSSQLPRDDTAPAVAPETLES